MTTETLPPPPATLARPRESWRSWAIRLRFNCLPSYRLVGGKAIYLSPDLTLARIRVRYGLMTYGQKGAMMGGVLYASIDPCYVALLSIRLGKQYVAWDKTATITFKKPARTTLYADFYCSEPDLDAIRRDADANGRTERTFDVVLADKHGVPHAEFTKTLVIKRRTPK